jgi:hypothetical protein
VFFLCSLCSATDRVRIKVRPASWLISITVVFLVAATMSGGAAAPANDRFSSAAALTGTNVTVTGTNMEATKEGGEPNHAGNAGGSSVWWTWTAPNSGDVQITTDGSDFDTLLGVYTGPRVNNLNTAASSDDHGLFVTSRVRFAVTQGTQYAIAVDGYNDGSSSATGSITVTLVFVQGPITRPVNDNFTSRISLQGLSVSATGTNVQATREANEPIHGQKLGDTSVWFTWTAPTNGPVRASTEGSSFDTLLGIYAGTTLANLIEIANGDDIDPINGILTSAAAFDAQAGQVFQIAVDGYDGAVGQIALRIELISTRLLAPERLPDGKFRFTLTGAAERTYDLQASDNLVAWEPLVRVFNTNGTLVITDSTATNVHRFYRALLLPLP